MQDSLPQGDPRLQKSSIGPRVATGYVDPCIVYLEATEEGEVPVLFACWARSSSEVREVDGTVHLKLAEVVVMTGRPSKSLQGWSMRDGKTLWLFSRQGAIPEIVFTKDSFGWKIKGFPYRHPFQNKTAYGFQGSLKYIDAESDQILRKLETGSSSRENSFRFAEKLLSLATVDWPSLISALAFSKAARRLRAPKKTRTTPSLLRRLISSFTGKKLAGV
jgi:hypothetical protein